MDSQKRRSITNREDSSDKLVYFLLDPLESLLGPAKPPFLIAKEIKENFNIVFASPMVDNEVADALKHQGFNPRDSGKHFYFSGSLLILEAWLRKSEFKLEKTNQMVVNFSQCFLANADIYYAQGPISWALDDMYPEMKRTYRLVYKLARRFFIRRDKGFIKKLREGSQLFIANSRFCAQMYETWGVKVDDVIYPPLDCKQFQPTTSKPSGDYVLAYIGKETRYSVLRAIAETGVNIKAFGFKTTDIPKYLLRQPNIKFLGRVSDEQLADLYSNALYTLFTFTHEPFGYVPVESMACGTPVLTYNRQGPGESMINDQVGWLVEKDEELATTAARLWRKGYPKDLRKNCRLSALKFDSAAIALKWRKLIEELLEKNKRSG
jgi:glycosyltransferase involved in cell wall biosynthesis